MSHHRIRNMAVAGVATLALGAGVLAGLGPVRRPTRRVTERPR